MWERSNTDRVRCPVYLHRHPLWHPGIDHVPYRSAAEVVADEDLLKSALLAFEN